MKSASEILLAALAVSVLAACRPDAHASAKGDDPLRCASCHTPEFVATKHPPHAEGDARPNTCGVCHTQASWHRWRVDHPGWELTGAHLKAAEDKALAGKENQVKCFWCHRGDAAKWKDTKKTCVPCHEDDLEDVHVPGHDTFGNECQDCHSTETWKKAKRPPRDAGIAADLDAGPSDAGAHDAAVPPPAPKPKPTPTHVPTATPTLTAPPKPTTKPDVNTGPSRRRMR